MLTFTILRSPKTHRCYIYNKDYLRLAQCDTMNDVIDYFYSWCEELSCKSVVYTQTDDKDVIRVMMD